MTETNDTLVPRSTAREAHALGVQWASQLAAEVKSRWRAGESPDVAGVLAKHPKLKLHRSVVIDLAYEEYRRRREAGESMDADGFSQRFPTLQRSLYLLIQVQSLLDQDACFRDLQSDIVWPTPGDHFLGFDLLSELGRGTFGRVFLAYESALGNRYVAVKVAPQGAEEAEILGKLRHSSIVPIYSVQLDEATGLTACCMPYLGRATLCDVLDRVARGGSPPARASVIVDAVLAANDGIDASEPLPADRILRSGAYVDGVIHLAAQLADALAHAHRRGICHRDLKPSNVLMSVECRPLLLDFNLSVDGQFSKFRIGGTLPYMPPEGLEILTQDDSTCGNWHPDPRSDIFCLGVIVYELLTGSLPFQIVPWDRPLEEVATHLRGQQLRGPRPVREKNPQVDRRLAGLIHDCLAFDPEERPQTAEALAAALRRHMSPWRRRRRWMGNHRKLVGAMAATFLAILMAWLTFLALRPPYAVRQLQRGLAYSDQGQYEQAVECLGKAIRFMPDSADAKFARGRAYQHLNNFRQAFEDYNAAFNLENSPERNAARGYCLAKMRYNNEAFECFRMALADGYETPGLLSDIGCTCLQLHRMAEAETYLKRAVKADGQLQVANLGLVRVFLGLALEGKPMSREALAHTKRAIETGPPSGDLYLDAGRLYALAAVKQPEWIQPAIECLQNAVRLGCDPKPLASEPPLFVLKNELSFKELLTRQAGEKRGVGASLFVDPL